MYHPPYFFDLLQDQELHIGLLQPDVALSRLPGKLLHGFVAVQLRRY